MSDEEDAILAAATCVCIASHCTRGPRRYGARPSLKARDSGGWLVEMSSNGDNLVVSTPLGQVRGRRATSRSGREYLAFSGLPYARPPINDRIFQPPEPAEPWEGIREAVEDGPRCIQWDTFQLNPKPVGELDCLYLSLYTHDVSGNYPVVVRIHGGGFMAGNGPKVTGPQFLMDEDVLVVMVNYRVGIYGFLCFEDEEMPGNQGLKDQWMALRWIQQNIRCFGGDPERVTLEGNSAGGASVFHHLISPLSQGLFCQAIAESGTSYNSWAVSAPGEAKHYSIQVITTLGGTYTTTKKAVEFLKEKDPLEVVSALKQLRVWQVDNLCPFKPAFEKEGPGAFLTWPVSKWVHKPVPVLMGMTSAEGVFKTEYFKAFQMDYNWYSEHFEEVAPLSLNYLWTSSNPDAVTKAVRNYYLPGGEITIKELPNLIKMYTAAIFSIGILDGANKHTGNVFFYYFDYLGENSFCGHVSKRNPSIHTGAAHADETFYLYNRLIPRDIGNLKGEDLELSKKLVKLWTNFIKYGTPTPQESELSWETWRPDRHRYLHISREGLRMREGLNEEEYAFWKGIPYRDNLEKFRRSHL